MVTWTGYFGRAFVLFAIVGVSATACGGDKERDDDGDAGGSGEGGSSGSGGTSSSGNASGGTTSGGTTSGGNASGGTGGTGTSGAGKSGMPDPALATFCEQVLASQIGRLERCNGVANAIAQKYVTVPPCAVWGPSVEADRMRFDSMADSAACISALQTLACDADALPPACTSVLSGRRVLGESCSFAAEVTTFSECEVGTACVGELLGSTTCEGTCVKRGLIGQACSGVQPCVSGETCTLNGCAPKGSEGSACGLSSSPECSEGLYCTDVVSNGTCEASLPIGATCNGHDAHECAPPGICDRGGDLTGTCKVPPKPGDSCVVDDFECGTGLSYCGADGTCQALSGIGEPCENDDGEGTYCLIGVCDESLATPLCAAQPPGAACEKTADCAAGSICLPGLMPQCSPKCF